MRLYSTLQHELVELPPPPAKVGIYVCGPTVYQRIHVGNGRPYVIFLWLRNWLQQRGYEVKLVSNITDVNDKIYAESEREKRASADLAREMSDWYLADTDRLGLGRPDAEPKATEMMVEIVQLITELVGSGHAYEAGGDVYFRVGSYGDYGRLSGQKPNQMSEQEPNPLKEDARDFALWKATKEGEDTSWDSPWGKGRPGWHIECSAMAADELGPAFEIHGGGLDLVFPHHENELAQSRAAGVRAHLDAQRPAPPDRRKDVEVARQHPDARAGAGRVGPRDAAPLLHDRALAQPDRLLARDDDAGAYAG